MSGDLYEKCPVCAGRGFLEDTEPEEYINSQGNQAIRFKPLKMPCPNNKCKDGYLIPNVNK